MFLSRIRRLRLHLDEHPEWLIYFLAFIAWVAMLPHILGSHGRHHTVSSVSQVVSWLLMIVAMMFPLLGDAVQTVAFRTYRYWRYRALAFFLVGYLAIWLFTALPVAWLLGWAGCASDLAAGIAFAAAGIWVFSPLHKRASIACHGKRPLAPAGWLATRDAVAYGSRYGQACLASCGPLMVGCALSGHGAVAMVGGALIGTLERVPFRPRKKTIRLLLAFLALWHGAIGLL